MTATPTNDSMTVSREMKVLFLQIMKQNTLTKEDAEALIKIFVDNGLTPKPARIVIQQETDEELYDRMTRHKKFVEENPQYKHLYEKK